MALTLPVEEMSRLQVSFKLLLPDGRLTFEMSSASASGSSQQCPPCLSGLKLHFQGAQDHTGLSLKVWASGLSEGETSLPTLEGAQQSGQQGASSIESSPILASAPLGSAPTSPKPAPPSLAGPIDVPATTVPSTPFPFPSTPSASSPSSSATDTPIYTDPYSDGISADLFNWQTLDTVAHPTIGAEFNYMDSFGINGSRWPIYNAFHGLDDLGPALIHSASEMPGASESDMQGIEQTKLPHRPAASTSQQSSEQQQPPSSFPHFHPDLPYHQSSSHINYPSTSSPQGEQKSSANSSIIGSEDTETLVSRQEFPLAASDASHSPRSTAEADSSRPYRCLAPDCDRWFKRDYTRKVHMLTHKRTKERKPFGCSVVGCPERFSRKHDRLRHEVGRHGLGSEWRCEPCNRFFSSKATMERHVLDKHGEHGEGAHQQ